MRKFVDNTYAIPKVKSPISQAVVVNKHCYISGQLSTDVEGGFINGTAVEQARQAFANVFQIAEAAGFSKDEIVFIDIAFTNLKDVEEINILYDELFDQNKRPARTIYQAAALPYGGSIKVTAIAIKE
jgi:2-iminobutanoate/2-iminopropanoate deaminase